MKRDLKNDSKSTILLRVKSGLNPGAHNTIPCRFRNVHQAIIDKALYLASSKSPWPIPLRTICDLQLQYGLRISEVLNITPYDLLTLGRIRIRSQKRGKDRIINYSDINNYLNFCRESSVYPFRDFNRFFVYREYKKQGLCIFHSKGKKSSITHSFRHIIAQLLDMEIENKEQISEFLGHKSLKSLESYIKS